MPDQPQDILSSVGHRSDKQSSPSAQQLGQREQNLVQTTTVENTIGHPAFRSRSDASDLVLMNGFFCQHVALWGDWRGNDGL